MRPELSGTAALARRRVEQLRVTHARLVGIRDAAIARDSVLTLKVGHAKGRLLLSEETNAALEGLQNRAHQRSVGVFERLLSAVLQDVLPGKGEVKLELGTERGAPALDVQIDNGGAREDALDGSGGAVTNVLSAGLRYAALSRTGNRKLMVLDEPDCWLKPERVPAFIRVLTEVAEKAKTQTILISHHEPATFEGLVSIVRLAAGPNGLVQTQVMQPHGAMWLDDEEPGLRSIRLINFRAHADTTLPLFPGVTALIGDNDLGKSTLAVSALRAVAYGEADDTLVRHGATEARVEIGIERNRRIEWVRRLKGSPRITYALYEGDALVHEGRPNGRGQVPEWVTEALGILRVDELDIQLGSQKEPVFLLNETASTRAQLLSVGRESGRLHALIDAYADLKRKDREQVRDGEAEIAVLRRRIEGSVALPSLVEQLEQLALAASEVESFATRQTQLSRFLARVDAVEQRRSQGGARLNVFAQLPASKPVLESTQRLADLLKTIQRVAAVAALRRDFPAAAVPQLEQADRMVQLMRTMERTVKVAGLRHELPVVVAPEVHDNRRLTELGQRLGRLGRKAVLAGKLPALPELPSRADQSGLSNLLGRLNAQAHNCSSLQRDAAGAALAANQSREELNGLIEAMGGECPVCGGELHEVAEASTHVQGGA